MSRRDEILSGIKQVESMPTAVQKAVGILNDEKGDMTVLARAVELDPGMTSNVLRIANSAYMGSMSRVNNLRDALVRLGTGKTLEIMVASGVAPKMQKEVRGYDLAPGRLLEHSIAVAVAAEGLGRRLGLKAPGHTFTSGILAGIGKTVLGTFMEVDAEPILELASTEDIMFDEAEDRVLGVNHAEVGALLLETWGLPEEIVSVVRWHLRPDLCESEDVALDLVHAGDFLAKTMGAGLGLDGMNYQPSAKVVKRIGLTPEVLDEVMAETLDKVSELREIFSPTASA